MSLALKAVRGAAWTIGGSVAGRVVGVVGTLALTHFLAPEVMGEVGVASILVLTANQISSLGLGQYVVARPRAGRGAVFHATLFYGAAGAAALSVLWVVREPLGAMVGAPDMIAYLPGLVIAGILDRASFLPQRVLLRDMRFKIVALTRSGSEFAFTGVSVGLAAAGWGGEAVVAGNLARSALRGAVFVAVVHWREWLAPVRLSSVTARDLLAFGVPISLASMAGFAARRWDNLLFSAMFGPAIMGLYNLAYNLADIPAEQIGEHVGDVLLPSFAHMDPDERPEALSRSISLLALVVFPLASGLAAIAEPLVAAIFNEDWQGVAPFLIILAALSVVRPVGWTIDSYLQAQNLPRHVMALSFSKATLLLALIAGLGSAVGPAWACAGVGVAYGLHALGSLFVVRVRDGLPMRRALVGMSGPAAACAVMAGAIVAVDAALVAGLDAPAAIRALAGVAIGAMVYPIAARVLAPALFADCMSLMRRSFSRS